MLALYSASKGVGSLIVGLNVAYDKDETHGFIWLKVITFGLTGALIVGAVLVMILHMAVPAALAFVKLYSTVEFVVTGARWLLMLALLAVALSALYRFGPDRDHHEWRWVSVGSIAACVVWLLASIGFALYAANFRSYNENFGSFGGAIMLLMWLSVSAYIILIRAELNAGLEAQTRYANTAGHNQPMGERVQKRRIDWVKARNTWGINFDLAVATSHRIE